jgi:hypothetical protein
MPSSAANLRLGTAARPFVPNQTAGVRAPSSREPTAETQAGADLLIRLITQIGNIERLQGEDAALAVVADLKRMLAAA